MTVTLPERMRAVVLTGHGGLDRLAFRDDVAVPAPAPGEVLVRVPTRGQALGHMPERLAEPIRAYERFEMVDVAGDTIRKTGQTPYL